MKSELILQYLGYLAVAVFCTWFIFTVLKVQGDFMMDSVEGVESFIGGTVIEGMKVTENEKKKYEKGVQNLDIWVDTFDKDYSEPKKEYLESIPSDAKEALLEMYDITVENQAVHQITTAAKALSNVTDSKGPNLGKFLDHFDKRFMGKLNENEDVRHKVLELLGRKK